MRCSHCAGTFAYVSGGRYGQGIQSWRSRELEFQKPAGSVATSSACTRETCTTWIMSIMRARIHADQAGRQIGQQSQFTRTHCRKRPAGRYGLGSRVCRMGRRKLNVSVKIKVPARWRTGGVRCNNLQYSLLMRYTAPSDCFGNHRCAGGVRNCYTRAGPSRTISFHSIWVRRPGRRHSRI